MLIDITNLGGRITDDSLHAMFSSYGQVGSARVSHNGSALFGQVDMPNTAQANMAIEKINGCIIDGKAIVVSRNMASGMLDNATGR